VRTPPPPAGYRMLIFALHREEVTHVVKVLEEAGFKAAPYHKLIGAERRLNNLRRFNTGWVPILVCSPVAARGLDFRGVTHVINYTFPENAVEYVHCVGRTARNGAPGWSATMYLPEEELLAEAMAVLLQDGESLERAFGRSKRFSVIRKRPLEERIEQARKKWERKRTKARRKRHRRLIKEVGFWAAQKVIRRETGEVRRRAAVQERVEAQNRKQDWLARRRQKALDKKRRLAGPDAVFEPEEPAGPPEPPGPAWGTAPVWARLPDTPAGVEKDPPWVRKMKARMKNR